MIGQLILAIWIAVLVWVVVTEFRSTDPPTFWIVPRCARCDEARDAYHKCSDAETNERSRPLGGVVFTFEPKVETLTDHQCMGWKRYPGVRQSMPCPYVGCPRGVNAPAFITQQEDGRRTVYRRAYERMKFAGTDTTYLVWKEDLRSSSR